jgi:hypothetical protein
MVPSASHGPHNGRACCTITKVIQNEPINNLPPFQVPISFREKTRAFAVSKTPYFFARLRGRGRARPYIEKKQTNAAVWWFETPSQTP